MTLSRAKLTFWVLITILLIVVSVSATTVPPAQASGTEGELSRLVIGVQALVEAGSLSTGNGNALTAKLEAARQSLARWQVEVAANQLEAFKAQVGAFLRTGKLSWSEGQPLIDEAVYVQAVIGCSDPLGCVTYRADEAIRLASALATSGEVGVVGLDSQYGVEVALDLQGTLLGHALELRAEDEGCSLEGGAAVANMLVSDPKVVAIVGTSCSGAAWTAAPIISDAGYVMVSPSNTAPVLTDPQYQQSGYLRTVWNDKEQSAVMASFVSGLGKSTSAVIAETGTDPTGAGPYTQVMAETFVETFTAAGGVNLATQLVSSGDPVSISLALDAIAAAGPPDVIYLPVFLYDAYLIVIEARSRAEFDGTTLATADGAFSPLLPQFAGEAAEGLLLSSPNVDYSANDLYADVLLPAYVAKYGEPSSIFHPQAFDATNMILAAIESTAVVSEGTVQVGRQALREALFATEGLEGATGAITCDVYGDCGAGQFMVLTVLDGEFVPVWP